MTTIIGVDYSGAKTDRNTWITEARLHVDTLEINCCRRIKRKCLTEFLEKLQDGDAIVAIDFPFSVPRSFAEELSDSPSAMPDVWEAVAKIEYSDFDERRRDFIERHGEMIRRGDAHLGGPFSPLKVVNPDMLPMTFYGMKMLRRLWKSERGFRVPPLLAYWRYGLTLLETMPGVLLRGFDLPARNYKTKNKTNKGRPEEVREEILAGLEQKLGQTLRINDIERSKCLNNADCLDSLVAAVGAAMWEQNPDRFRHPAHDELPDAQLEGWIYVPKPA